MMPDTKLAVVLIFAGVISGSLGQNITGWCPNIVSDMQRCSNEHLSSFKDISSQFSSPDAVMNVQTVMSSIMSRICQKPAPFEDFLDCMYKKLFACIPVDWRKAFADASQQKESIRYMCKNINDVDIGCLSTASRTSVLTNCLIQGMTGMPDLSTSDRFLAYTCNLFPKYLTCTETAYKTCPKRTAEVISGAFQYQKPVGCDACRSTSSLLLPIALLAMLCVSKRMI